MVAAGFSLRFVLTHPEGCGYHPIPVGGVGRIWSQDLSDKFLVWIALVVVSLKLRQEQALSLRNFLLFLHILKICTLFFSERIVSGCFHHR